MAELLLELFSEEIPARMQDRAREDLARLVGEALTAAGIGFDRPVKSFATPRRLTVVMTGLPLQQADRVVERRGPRADAPEQARAGFLRGLTGLDYELQEREDKKARVLFALVRERGRAVAELVAEQLPQAIGRLPWPNSMRWGADDFRWVRPLQAVLCLLDGAVVPFELAGVVSGDRTRGHRFMAPEAFPVRDFADYVVKLRDAKVILDGAERRAIVARRAAELAEGEGLALADDPALLDELRGLVEWPVPLLAGIDEGFMALPPEALVTTMRTNQKYLALRTHEGGLARRFVLVANMEASDGGAAIVAGNERVLRARLWDARFFWEQDSKVSLERRLPDLDRMVFHAELGSQGQRVERLVALSGALVPFVPGADRTLAERAALLAKADLVTGMVGEFPELQGIMGGYYARAQGEPAEVATAIRDHYAPKGPDDACPSAPASVVVALADKLDMLAGFFGAGIRPTGSKDPFALRRAGLGIIRLILDNRLRLPLRGAFAAALAGYGDRFQDVAASDLGQELTAFLADRLKVHLRERGVRHDVVAAAFAVGVEDDLVRLIARAEALQAFLDSEDGRNLLTAYRRASSIVGIEEKKDGRRYEGQPAAGALVDPCEETLFAALEMAGPCIEAALATEDYGAAMAALAALRGPVDRFFDSVMVNAPEPELRLNRLLLLSRVRSALQRVADFSLVEDSQRREGAA
jgi:glycyl-tRNA synthetase beta chain